MGRSWKEPLKVRVMEGSPIPVKKLAALKELIMDVALRNLKDVEEATTIKEAT